MLWCQGAQNIGLSNHKLSPRQSALSDHNATPVTDRQTDGQTDEHHDNSATIRSNENSEQVVNWFKHIKAQIKGIRQSYLGIQNIYSVEN